MTRPKEEALEDAKKEAIQKIFHAASIDYDENAAMNNYPTPDELAMEALDTLLSTEHQRCEERIAYIKAACDGEIGTAVSEAIAETESRYEEEMEQKVDEALGALDDMRNNDELSYNAYTTLHDIVGALALSHPSPTNNQKK